MTSKASDVRCAGCGGPVAVSRCCKGMVVMEETQTFTADLAEAESQLQTVQADYGEVEAERDQLKVDLAAAHSEIDGYVSDLDAPISVKIHSLASRYDIRGEELSKERARADSLFESSDRSSCVSCVE